MEAIKENKLGTKPIPSLLFGMAIPLIFSNIIQALYNVVDGIYVAQFSKAALTATTLVFPAQMLMFSVAAGTATGTNSLLSRSLGAKAFDDANDTARHGLLLAIISYLVFVLLGLVGADWFIGLFTSDPELSLFGREYLLICFVGGIGIFLGMTFGGMLQSTGHASLCMATQAIGAVVNIILDPVMIFGRWGFPAMGIRGAAYATIIGQFASAMLGFCLNVFCNKDIRLSFSGFRFKKPILREIYRVGVPSMLMQSIGSLMNVGMDKILIAYSDTAVSVFGVYYKLQSFVFLPVFGLTGGMVPIVGYNYGARRPERIGKAIKLTAVCAVVFMGIGTLVFHLFPEKLLSLFSADAEMLALGVPALRIVSIPFMLAACCITMGDSLTGMGIGYVSAVNSFLRQLLVLLPAAYLLQHFFGIRYVWYAFVFSEFCSLTYTSIMFSKIYRRRVLPLKQQEAPSETQTACPQA